MGVFVDNEVITTTDLYVELRLIKRERPGVPNAGISNRLRVRVRVTVRICHFGRLTRSSFRRSALWPLPDESPGPVNYVSIIMSQKILNVLKIKMAAVMEEKRSFRCFFASIYLCVGADEDYYQFQDKNY